jgi:hypothetical protein
VPFPGAFRAAGSAPTQTEDTTPAVEAEATGLGLGADEAPDAGVSTGEQQ